MSQEYKIESLLLTATITSTLTAVAVARTRVVPPLVLALSRRTNERTDGRKVGDSQSCFDCYRFGSGGSPESFLCGEASLVVHALEATVCQVLILPQKE